MTKKADAASPDLSARALHVVQFARDHYGGRPRMFETFWRLQALARALGGWAALEEAVQYLTGLDALHAKS
jgi:hypothetical protein